MSNKNVKYWNHDTLEWKNTRTHTTIEEKDYKGIVWKDKYSQKGRPENTRALKRLGQWITRHSENSNKKGKEGEWRLSKVAQEFTQRGWTLSQVEEDIATLVKLVKPKNKEASKRIAELLQKKNRSFVPSEKTNTKPLEEGKMLDWLDDWK